MRLLFTIPHFFGRNPSSAVSARHGSLGKPEDRLLALTRCIGALRQLYGASQCVMQLSRKQTDKANQDTAADIDIVVCVSGDRHLLDRMTAMDGQFERRATDENPHMLGFQCRQVLAERHGGYDYYGYLEDDLILHDPCLFVKLAWFNGHVGQDALLLPNRFERSTGPLVHKAYVDGDLKRHLTAPFQNVDDCPWLQGEPMGRRVVFRRPLNPHSGCYFLNPLQMEAWIKSPWFLDRDTSFIGPLESMATLGVMRTFKIYKPAPENANFLEIEHYGSRFISLIRERREHERGDFRKGQT